MPTSIRLSDDISNRLTLLSERTGRSKAFYIRKLFEDNFEELEYQYSILHDLEEYRSGKVKTYSLEEIMEENGLDY